MAKSQGDEYYVDEVEEGSTSYSTRYKLGSTNLYGGFLTVTEKKEYAKWVESVKAGDYCPGTGKKPRVKTLSSYSKYVCPDCHKKLGLNYWGTFNKHGFKVNRAADKNRTCVECENEPALKSDYLCESCRAAYDS